MAPEKMTSELARLKAFADGGSPTLDQLALANFLEAGEMDRHLRRMRQVYRRRRDLLTAALADFLPGLRIGGVSAGLHLMMDLPLASDENAVIANADKQSIRLFGAAPYRARSRQGAPALVIGYGCAADALIREGVQRLARVIRRATK